MTPDQTPPPEEKDAAPTEDVVGVDVPRLVRLAPLTEKIIAEAGWIIDWWVAGRFCPECEKRGRERAGAEFQHMDRCTDCDHVWTPETWYLRIRLPNADVLAPAGEKTPTKPQDV